MSHLLRLFGFARQYWGWAVIALTGMFCVSFFSALQAYLIKPLFDDLLLSGSQAASDSAGVIVWLDDRYNAYLAFAAERGWNIRVAVAVLIFLVMILKNVWMFLSRYAFAVVGLSMVQDIRRHLYNRLIGMPLKFFSTSNTGELVSRIVSDVIFIQQAMAERFGDLIQESVTLAALLALIFSINVKLAFFSLVITPLTLYPIVRFSRSLRKASHRSQEEMANMAGILTETFQGNRIVKAFTAESYEKGRFQSIAGRHLKANLKARLIQALNSPIVETLGILLALAMFVYAGHEINKGAMTVGEFTSFLAALFMMYAPIKKLNKVNLALQQAVVAADRVFLLTDMEDEFATDGSEPFPGLRETIRYENVSFFYTKEKGPALRDITLDLRKGEIVAIVGASGSGKSTLCSLLPRFYDPSEGTITIDGVDLRQFTKQSLREQIGIVTQENILFNDTVFHNIAYAMEHVTREKVKEAVQAAFALEFIEELPDGLDTVIGEGGLTLSGGQRQRLSIARAIAKDPPILILDEATSSLDSESEKLVQCALQSLLEGRTTLIIAHRLSTIKHADRIVVLEGGKIKEEGKHAELMEKNGTYAAMVRMQMFEEEQ